MLQSTTTVHDDTARCSLTGELDAFTAPALHGHLLRAEKAPRVVVDMAGVPFVDSSGVHALVAGIRNLRAAGATVVLAVPAAHMRRLFRSIGLDRLVPLGDGLVPSAEARP